jgi:uncharacterized protein YndB with AHSA1/START domain
MSVPTTASVSVEVAASPEVVYDLVADVTRMGEWSPECRSCTWLGPPGAVGSRFRGHNKRGLARWTTTAEVLAADRPRRFSFATLSGDDVGTRWTYDIEDRGERTRITESFEAVSAPWFISFVETYLIRDRQQQLEKGMASTLERIKAAAESGAPGASP